MFFSKKCLFTKALETKVATIIYSCISEQPLVVFFSAILYFSLEIVEIISICLLKLVEFI